MAHGVRKGVARGIQCPSGKGMCYTSWDAARAALVRLDAERVYRCSQCGYLHVTRYTDAEYAQRMADTDPGKVCTSAANRGIVVSSTTDGDSDEATEGGRDPQPAEGTGGSGAPTFKRGPTPRPAPSPATVAAFVARRRDSGRGR